MNRFNYIIFLLLSFSIDTIMAQNFFCNAPCAAGKRPLASQNFNVQSQLRVSSSLQQRSQRRKQPTSEAQRLGRQFLKAQNFKDQSQFKSILSDAVQRFNADEFYEFIDTRDGYGCTCLIRAAALTDIDQIIYILEKLEEFYDKQDDGVIDVFNVINAQCLQGHTAFYLIAQNGTRQQVDLMLYHVIRLLGSERELFLQFLNARVYEDGSTVLHWLAYEGSSVNLEAVVIVAERILGKGSDEFEAFINAQSINGRTPLDKTYFNARHRQFLKQNGGVSLHIEPPEFVEAHKIGLALIDSIRDDKFNIMQKIITQAQKKYKNDPHLFLEVMMARTDAGWDPLMNAVAINAINHEYTAYLLHAIETFFQDDEEAFYSILRNVAQDGRGALIITMLQRNFVISHLLIKTIKEYAPSKYFMYILYNIRTYVKGYTPLIAAANFSSEEKVFNNIIMELLDGIVEIFGKDSRPMELFVNTRDLDNYPPLAYSITPELDALLRSYGATLEPLPF